METPSERRQPETCFYGTVTVGERGQIVIPAEARREVGVHPGDKLLIIKHPGNQGFLLLRMDTMREFMTMLLESLDRSEEHASDTAEPPQPRDGGRPEERSEMRNEDA